jgi:hypothetical protein
VVRRGMSQPGPAGRLMFQSWCCDVIEELTFDDSTIIYTYHIYNYIYITKYPLFLPTGPLESTRIYQVRWHILYSDGPGPIGMGEPGVETWSLDGLQSMYSPHGGQRTFELPPPIQRISFLPES